MSAVSFSMVVLLLLSLLLGLAFLSGVYMLSLYLCGFSPDVHCTLIGVSKLLV